MDLACSVQAVIEQAMLKMAKHVREHTGARFLCLAGGVALNCVANGKLLREGPFDDLWIQPAAGDAGGALGAALAVWHEYLDKPRTPRMYSGQDDRQKGSLLGPEFTDAEIESFLVKYGIPFEKYRDKGAETQRLKDTEAQRRGKSAIHPDIITRTAQLIANGKVVGWFQGRMEFGPRALGSRSILGDPRSPDMQRELNLKIKFRESFRPFAPAVLVEETVRYFELDRPSPYMLLTADVAAPLRHDLSDEQRNLSGIDKLYVQRSQLPAITHVDYSARLQTVDRETNPKFWELLRTFKDLTGYPVLINTSFNVRGEPIVAAPLDAYKCFMRTEMDYLVLGNFLLDKKQQPKKIAGIEWKETFESD
jgi:carbamoyltransferase